MEPLLPLPGLHYNGAENPDNWRPYYTSQTRRPVTEGDLVGWRYGAWRAVEVHPVPEVDLHDDERQKLDQYMSRFKEEPRPKARMLERPYRVVLRHEAGPLILNPGEASQRLHDGACTVHFRVTGIRLTGIGSAFTVLPEPYHTCSCHGHIWPCQEIDRTTLAQHQMRRMGRLMATADPGVCAHCLEPITTRQKSLTFPETSRLVPGAPGPTFHAGRSACWDAAESYERSGRLADNPDIVRLASCPGIRFIHEQHGMPTGRRVECTAGPACTGLHGPAGHRRETPCWYQVHLAANDGAYARPSLDCGYRSRRGGCLGADLSSGGTSLSPVAADLLWSIRNHGHNL